MTRCWSDRRTQLVVAEALDEASAYADFNYACDAIAPMLDEMSDADAPQFVKVCGTRGKKAAATQGFVFN